MKEEQSLKRVETDVENGENVKEVQENSNLTGDYSNVAILLFLYLLQGNTTCDLWLSAPKLYEISGIPLGVSMAVPILLQNRGVSYSELAGFTFAFYPFTSKSDVFIVHLSSYQFFKYVYLTDSEDSLGANC